MAETFTWIPFYEELADKLAAYRDRQGELIAFLKELQEKGRKITPLNDRDAQGNRFLLKEIDPFTFYGVFNRGTTFEERSLILGEVKAHFGVNADVPSDFAGIPVLNNQKSWLFAYAKDRAAGDIDRLWDVFEYAIKRTPFDSPGFGEAFDRALQVRMTKFNLTMGLFWIRPHTFLSLDRQMRRLLGLKLPPKGLSFDFYRRTVEKVVAEQRNIPKLSAEAWEQGAKNKSSHPAPVTSDENVWLVGAYWSDRDPADQTARFIEEGVWENGYEDRYLDDVRSMQVGDIIGIKSTSTQKADLPFDNRGKTISKMTIKALGTVVGNAGDGRTVEVDWDPDFTERDWYFYTYRRTVWQLRKDSELARRLIEFLTQDKEQDYPYFLSRWFGDDPGNGKGNRSRGDEGGESADPYSIDEMLEEGVFLAREDIESLLQRFLAKKNIILQGAPGVGKTFIARKLAYLAMEARDDARVKMVQFHQSYSYEDFVRGYRPGSGANGGFELRDGPFLKFCKKAAEDPDHYYVFIIDEINRGNLSQIFGEFLMLLEGDKRDRRFAVPLMYPRDGEPEFHVPSNVYLLGLMNIADRSLAMVDYALRRRFGFFTLTPRYEDTTFHGWLTDRGMESGLVELMTGRMAALNRQIAEDRTLGENFQIGHSYFCPRGTDFSGLDRRWFDGIVQTEIGPLLDEYWFDNKDKVNQAVADLLAP